MIIWFLTYGAAASTAWLFDAFSDFFINKIDALRNEESTREMTDYSLSLSYMDSAAEKSIVAQVEEYND